jgi:hypothetical protein
MKGDILRRIMSASEILSYILENVVIVIATGIVATVIGGLIVWWFTKRKDESDQSPQITQSNINIGRDNKPIAIGGDFVLTKENERGNDERLKEENFDKIEKKIEEAEENYDNAIRDYNEAVRNDVEDDELDDLEEEITKSDSELRRKFTQNIKWLKKKLL